MKWFCAILILLFSCNADSQSLSKIEDFEGNKGNLKMYTYVPENLNLSDPVPLVLVLHGCTQSAEMIAKETGWNKLADSLNFIVVYPEQRQINNVAKCFNYFIGGKAKKDKGEVASIREMIAYMLKMHPIDGTKIFITGMSAGGAMTNAMLNAYPKLFNAGAIMAGPSKVFQPNNGDTQPRVAILQGTQDKIVPFHNAEEIKAQWIKKHHIDLTKNKTINVFQNNPLISITSYFNEQKEQKLVTLYAEEVEHKLMISPGDKINKGGTLDFHTKDINFHSTYWIAEFFALVN